MIDINIVNILGIAVIANMIAHWFLPIQRVKNKLANFLSSFLPYVGKALGCSKCLSLWIGLLVFQDLLTAALTSLIGYLINHLIDRVEEWYK